MSFAWSLKPIFIWVMIILGIDLDRSRTKSIWGHRLIMCLCGFWLFLFGIPLHIIDIMLAIHSRFIVSSSYVYEKSLKIMFFVFGILGILFHLSLILSASERWKPLWKQLKRAQDVIGENTIYNRLRRDTILELLLLATVVLAQNSENVKLMEQTGSLTDYWTIYLLHITSASILSSST